MMTSFVFVGARRSVVALAVTALLPSAASAQSARGGQATFTKDVAPILQRSCVTCHRPGEIAPMSLITYEDARPWARSIKTRVASREMPPWHIDRTIGIQEFKDDPSLTGDEIATIVRWVDAGAPRGNPADMPPLRQFADSSEWQIGKPDLVIKFPTYKVPATGADLFGSLYTASPLTEDRYIKAIQTRAVDERSRKVVHHALSYSVEGGENVQNDGDDSRSDGGLFLVEYASGKNAEVYGDDSGVLLQAGRRFKLDYHLHSIGEPVDAKVELGIIFYPKEAKPKYVRWSKQLGFTTTDLDIPGNTVVRFDGYTRLNKAAKITAFQPHMHIRGKAQCLELIYPNASTEMINCAHFNYNWHLTYNYKDDVAPLVPAGTLLHIISWQDNTPSNKFNPDPKNWVGNGSRTIDEMAFAWIGWYDMTDEEYKAAWEERKAARQRRQSKQTQAAQQGQ
jgi:mono/diheme cytochrome c family protein